uniref:SH3_10 domain-containing protein n=2 Tax=Macrostomum lignano TaxID=282301 RepID=A0A1I8J841_9PLAT
ICALYFFSSFYRASAGFAAQFRLLSCQLLEISSACPNSEAKSGMALRLCAQSANSEWQLLNQLSNAVQGSEDAVLESVTHGSPSSSGWMPQLEPSSGAMSDHSSPADRLQQFWLEAGSLATCLQLQLEQQKSYHLFYQTLAHYEASLEAEFDQARERLQRLEGHKEDASAILDCTQNLLTTSILWWRRVDSIMAQSRRCPPLSARLEPIEFKRPAQLLVDFAAPEVSVKAGREVFLVDNTNRDQWIVETCGGVCLGVPSLCVTIAGGDPAALERAAALRLRLLASWTIALKEIGRALIGFMLQVFRRISAIESQTEAPCVVTSHQDIITDGELRPLLATMEQLLQSYWAQHPEFEELRDRMRRVRASLAICDAEDCLDDWTRIDIHTIFLRLSPLVMSSSEEPDSAAKQSEMHGLLGQLMRRYRDLTRHWEAFRLSGDGSGSSTFGNDETASFQFCRDLAEEPQHGNNEEAWPPELLRLLQLGSQTIAGISKASTADAGRTYRTEFTIDVVSNTSEGSDIGNRNGIEETTQTSSPVVEHRNQRHLERPKVRFRREPPPANAASPILSDSEEEHNLEGGRPLSEVIEDYKREETEAKSRLVISCVVDTKDKAVLSLDEAVQRGIVSWDTGSYLNRETGDWMPIQAALSRGLIIAESRTEGRAKVKNRRVYGLVTLQSTDSKSADKLAKAAGDGGSYLIYSALDVANGTALSFQAAKEAGVIDAEEGVFWNSRTGEALELPVAIKKGFVRARKVVT